MNQVILWVIALSMAYSSAWLLRKSSISKSSLINSIVFYVLVMMASMFAGAIFYLVQPTGVGLAEALGFNMIVMSVGVLVVLHYWTRDDDQEGAVKESSGISDELELQRSIILSRAYVVYFLVMMASMTAVGIVYIINITITGLIEGLVIGNAIMIPGIVAILWYASKHPNETNQMRNQSDRSIRLERWILVFLVLLNEFVMGWAFVLASESSEIANGSLLVITSSTLDHVLGSDWFLFTLAFEVLFSLCMLRGFFSKDFVRIGIMQTLILAFIPTAINLEFWATLCLFANFTVLIVLSYHYIRKKSSSGEKIGKYLGLALALESLTMLGLLIWFVNGNTLILLISAVGQAVLYFDAILERITIEKSKVTNSLLSDVRAAKDVPTSSQSLPSYQAQVDDYSGGHL